MTGAAPHAVRENIARHDQVARQYDDSHTEIFNRVEQARLERDLRAAAATVESTHRRALDFGAGTGNLSRKLLRLGFEVTAADVSANMLSRLAAQEPEATKDGTLRTFTLDGGPALSFPDGHFAFVAAYSVLHHIPDYLGAVRELARVVAPGGILFLDHEMNESHWRSPAGVRINRLLTQPRYAMGRAWARVQRLWGVREPALPPPAERAPVCEGDIHIYADDHIEWQRVRDTARDNGIEELSYKEYLLCRETGRFPWRYWLCRGIAVDMGLYVGRRPALARR
jgi:SAM-dependent methyltransferase